ncbi:hypothetical protein EJB05_17175 [Eragrostis curvula]|uniref:Uncharacterized protein n=1 Tax=Eragrostis curvula TaxID=38414 RepID=A0A5J9VIC7_9POAL|nr:hypothetical protein EJB05_17175 [Eragrostis curvula]
MAPRNSKVRALLMVSLYTCLLFQGSSGLRCTYCNCLEFCKQLNPGYGQYCRQQCYQGKQCDFQCPPMEAPRMMADDGHGPEMGVAVAAGGDNLGTGNDGAETYRVCFFSCRKKYPARKYFSCCEKGCRHATKFDFKCPNNPSAEMGVFVAAGGGNVGKGNNGTETGGAAPSERWREDGDLENRLTWSGYS